MDLLKYLLDIDLVINLFLLFSKKLPWRDALILTLITVGIMYVYLTVKNNQSEAS